MQEARSKYIGGGKVSVEFNVQNHLDGKINSTSNRFVSFQHMLLLLLLLLVCGTGTVLI